VKRRTFIAGLGSAAAWPVAVQAQQPAMPVIGFLHNASPETSRDRTAAVHRGLAETGYVEGKNVAIEHRWAEGQSDRLPALAADLVRREVAVIATPGYTQSALVAKAATQTIPIFFCWGPIPWRSASSPALTDLAATLRASACLILSLWANSLR
jgi:putative tryptophan/tyrosine transport system substrate-binding protein